MQTALSAAAVVEQEFRIAVLRGVLGLPDSDLLDALDAALTAHLLE